MKENGLIKAAAFVILAPVVIGLTAQLVGLGVGTVKVVINKIQFNKKLKEGKIVKIDGRYYEVETTKEEE